MSKHSKLIEQAELFEKLAYDAHALANQVAAHRDAIKAEVAGGIQAINRLYTSNRQAGQSTGLQAVDEMFGKMGEYLPSLTAQYAEQNLPSIKALLQQGLFYANRANAGTGYDPWTRVGDAHSPGAYLDRIDNHVKNLEKLLVQSKSQTKAAPQPGV